MRNGGTWPQQILLIEQFPCYNKDMKKKRYAKCWLRGCPSCGKPFHVQGWRNHYNSCKKDELLQILQKFMKGEGYEVERHKGPANTSGRWHEWLTVAIPIPAHKDFYYFTMSRNGDEVHLDKIYGGVYLSIHDPKFFSKLKRHFTILKKTSLVHYETDEDVCAARLGATPRFK